MGTLAKMWGPTGECMPIDYLIMILEQPEGSEIRSHCEQHIASCAFCSSELALFRQFESAQPGSGEREIVSAIVDKLREKPFEERAPWWSRLWRPRVLMAAAIALTAASLFIMMNLNTRVDRPEVQVDRVMRSPQIAVVAPIGEVNSAPARLQWRAVSGAQHYNVRILEVDRTQLWSTTVTSNSAEIPQKVTASFSPLRKLLWEVTAADAGGNSIASSGLQSFVVKK